MTELDYRTRCLRQKINACVGCGDSSDLIVHHINGDRDDNRLENLIPTCRSCHSKIHNGTDLPPYLQRYQDELPEDKMGWVQSDTPQKGRTTITVSDELWEYLHERKERGESYDQLLRRLLNIGIEDRHDQGEIEA